MFIKIVLFFLSYVHSRTLTLFYRIDITHMTTGTILVRRLTPHRRYHIVLWNGKQPYPLISLNKGIDDDKRSTIVRLILTFNNNIKIFATANQFIFEDRHGTHTCDTLYEPWVNHITTTCSLNLLLCWGAFANPGKLFDYRLESFWYVLFVTVLLLPDINRNPLKTHIPLFKKAFFPKRWP